MCVNVRERESVCKVCAYVNSALYLCLRVCVCLCVRFYVSVSKRTFEEVRISGLRSDCSLRFVVCVGFVLTQPTVPQAMCLSGACVCVQCHLLSPYISSASCETVRK